MCFFLQAEDGIRDLVRSRGLGDVYKRQHLHGAGRGHDPDVLAIGADQADFIGTDAVIDARAGIAVRRRRIVRSAGYGDGPFGC